MQVTLGLRKEASEEKEKRNLNESKEDGDRVSVTSKKFEMLKSPRESANKHGYISKTARNSLTGRAGALSNTTNFPVT